MSDQKTPNDWFCCGFEGTSLTMNVMGEGRGGMAALRQFLETNFVDTVGVGLFRVTAVDDRGVTISFRTKLILVIFQGPKMPVMKRAKVASHNSVFAGEFSQNMVLQIDDLSDLSQENMERKLRAAGGAHQPTSFDFTNDQVDNS